MAFHVGDLLRTGATNFTATETNLTNLLINGTSRAGYWGVAQSTSVTGGTAQVTTITAGSRPTGGTYTMTIGGVTVTVNTTDTAAVVQAAILAMKNVVLNNILYPTLRSDAVVVTGAGASGWVTADVILTFGGQLANQPITVTNNTASVVGGGTFSVANTTTGVGPTCLITFQDSDDGTTWRTPAQFGSIYLPPGGGQARPVRLETQRKYISSTATFGGTGVFTKMQVAVAPHMEGIG